MTVTMDRQMSKFQARVQQELILKDDEIERLKSDITQTNAEIVQIEDQINIEKQRNDQANAKKTGNIRKQKASIETIKARLNAAHAEKLQRITEEQSNLIDEIHHEFETKLAQIEQYSDTVIAQKTKPVTDEIKKTKEQIEKLKQKITDQEKKGHSDTEDEIMENQEIEISRVQRLENALKDKNKERFDSLIAAKAQLSQCVSTLEESEKEHRVNIDNLLQRLRQLDDKYDDRIKRMKDVHEREIEPLKRRKAEVEKRLQTTMRAMDSADAQHRRTLGGILSQGDALKLEYQSVCSRSVQQQAEDDKARATNSKFESLQKQLAEKEQILAEQRSANESMKREVMRLRHEARVAKRRERLNI